MAYKNREVSVDDVVLSGILAVLNGSNVSWTGTMTQLTNDLNQVLDKQSKSAMPGSPSALRVVINRVINRLRSRRITVKFGRTTDSSRTRYVKFISR